MTVESIVAGRAIYERMECAKCHGRSGRGDGPSAAEFKDAWGNAIRPADFTVKGGIRGGDSARDIYRTFMTGINGTPMPSYEGQLSADEAWQLAHFTVWLRRD